MNDRIVKQTTVNGGFSYPIGFSFFDWTLSNRPKTVLVSTVQLDGAHLESEIPGILGPETGFETAVFLAGYMLAGTIYQEHYKTRRQANAGHERVIAALMDRTLKLAIPIGYFTIDHVSGDKSEHQTSVMQGQNRQSKRT